jgi:hypothetical protein
LFSECPFRDVCRHHMTPDCIYLFVNFLRLTTDC